LKRDTDLLAKQEFDLLVVGGGIFGACIAWSAVLRGYSVALIEQADFAHATSSNHYKFIHGGIRYLQHADLYRMRESSRERSALVRIAPHLAYPMPIVLPTYGHGKKGRLMMRAGMLAYDLLTLDRNRGIGDRTRRTPNGSFLSRDEVIRRFPGTSTAGLTGAAVFHDGQMYNPSRLVLSFLRSAHSNGATIANYVEAEQFIRSRDRINGCVARDRQSGDEFEIRSRMTVNAAGPWAADLLLRTIGLKLQPTPSFSRDLAFVIDRPICPTHALGCQSVTHDTDALLDRGGRHLFLVPWRGKTLVGVWHRYTKARPDRLTVSREELGSFLQEINSAYAGLNLQFDDIKLINTGLILFGSEEDQKSGSDHSFAKRSVVVDHARQGVEGLVTVIGARATVARGTGDRTLDLVDRKFSRSGPNTGSDWRPIYGGDFSDFEALVRKLRQRLPKAGADTARAVAHNYGTAYEDLLRCAPDESYLETVGASNVLKVEIVHAVQREMASNLADVVFRRTELGTAGDPGLEAMSTAADLAAAEFGWDPAKRDSELRTVRETLERCGPWQFVARNDEMPAGE
jgi:glycerol-3-phosphate dehydrogenase